MKQNYVYTVITKPDTDDYVIVRVLYANDKPIGLPECAAKHGTWSVNEVEALTFPTARSAIAVLYALTEPAAADAPSPECPTNPDSVEVRTAQEQSRTRLRTQEV